jgi:hypothetical protein
MLLVVKWYNQHLYANVYGVFHMYVFFGDVWCIMLLTNKLGHSLHHTFAIETCMCPIIDGDLVIPLKICSNGRFFHLWLHSYNEGPPRLNISFILWHCFFLPRWWVLVLSWVVRRGPTINPYEMGDELWDEFYKTSCICCKWWKDMSSFWWSLLINKRLCACHIRNICSCHTIGENWV